MESKLNWCPVCHYKWQTWTESHKRFYEIFKKMDKFVSAELSKMEICPECKKAPKGLMVTSVDPAEVC